MALRFRVSNVFYQEDIDPGPGTEIVDYSFTGQFKITIQVFDSAAPQTVLATKSYLKTAPHEGGLSAFLTAFVAEVSREIRTVVNARAMPATFQPYINVAVDPFNPPKIP